MKEDEKKEDHEMMKERDERWKANVVIPLFTIKIIFFSPLVLLFHSKITSIHELLLILIIHSLSFERKKERKREKEKKKGKKRKNSRKRRFFLF